jgi:hypothetical protein
VGRDAMAPVTAALFGLHGFVCWLRPMAAVKSSCWWRRRLSWCDARVCGGGPSQRSALDVGAGSARWCTAGGDLLAHTGLVLPTCGVPSETWTEAHPAIAPRACLTERAQVWTFEQVGAGDATVSAVATQLG